MLISTINEQLSERPAEEWLERFHKRSISAVPIHDTKSIWSDDHVKQRGLYKEMEKPDGNPAKMIAHPIRYDIINVTYAEAPPSLGEYSREVLQDVGLTSEEIDRLLESGIVE